MSSETTANYWLGPACWCVPKFYPTAAASSSSEPSGNSSTGGGGVIASCPCNNTDDSSIKRHMSPLLKPPPREFPSRLFVQTFDTSAKRSLPPDYQLVADELKSRNPDITVVAKTTEEIMAHPLPLNRKTDLVVGNFTWTHLALKQLNIPMPEAPDYPDCLKLLLYRRVWKSTLAQVAQHLRDNNKTNPATTPRSDGVFIKPALDAKAFSAIVEPHDQMLDAIMNGIPDVMPGLGEDFPVFCAEVVDMLAEYRVYCVDGKVRSVCPYASPTRGGGRDDDDDGKKKSSLPPLDMDVVNFAVSRFAETDEGREVTTGCGIDFAIMKINRQLKRKTAEDAASPDIVTGLCEVNDGYSLGRYEGCSAKDYTDVLVSRWWRLMQE